MIPPIYGIEIQPLYIEELIAYLLAVGGFIGIIFCLGNNRQEKASARFWLRQTEDLQSAMQRALETKGENEKNIILREAIDNHIQSIFAKKGK